MKIKNSLKVKQKPLIRRLVPKLQPHSKILIKGLSFSNSQNGTTIVKIYPSQTVLTSNSLIEMIESKKESIVVNDNVHVLRDDILYAIHNLSCEGSQADSSVDGDRQFSPINYEKPKRPTNAFILYRMACRKKIKALFPSFTNSDISKFIGAMWKAASKDVKEKYINQANQCRILHKKAYPNFEYNVKKEDGESNGLDIQSNTDTHEEWDSYFDWCLQVTTEEAMNNDFETSGDALSLSPQYSPGAFQTKLDMQDLMDLSPAEELNYQDWTDLCNIVAEFTPEQQHSLIDEKLWASLNVVDITGNSQVLPFMDSEELERNIFR